MRNYPLCTVLFSFLFLGVGCIGDTSDLGDVLEDVTIPLSQVDPNAAVPPPTAGILGQGFFGNWEMASYSYRLGSLDRTMAHHGRSFRLVPVTVDTAAVNYTVATYVEDFSTEVINTGGSVCSFTGSRSGTAELRNSGGNANGIIDEILFKWEQGGTAQGTCEYAGGNPNDAAGQVTGTTASPSLTPQNAPESYKAVLSDGGATLTLNGGPVNATIVLKRR
ncbi:MAG: hypothetical protein AAB886_02615 [Patescibacteria group bacterium]